MDGNKDEALKCLRIGQEALESGDRNRAFKFITKARRLDPTLPVDHLLSSVSNDNSDSPSDSSSSTGPQIKPSSTKPSESAANAFSSSSCSKGYTEEQITLVRQIKKQKDYYLILGLERDCSVEDVRKAYRKLSLKVHPDKNKAPGSEEAFKAVSKAFQCLSNEESRKKYDVMGTEEEVYNQPTRHRSAHSNFNGFYDADIDADEIFRNFFYGMQQTTTPFGGFRFSTGMGPSTRNETNGSSGFNIRTLIQLLPVLLFLLMNFFPSSEPVYSLYRNYPYDHKVFTPKGVPYFVKTAKFDQEYPQQTSERVALEEHIERDFFSQVSKNCRTELQRRQWGLSNQTPHCDMLKKFQVA